MARRKHKNKLAPEVVHPRYGLGPAASRYRGPELDAWRFGKAYHALNIYPQTAIKADPKFQKNTYGPYDYYVDQLLRCQGCKRAFIYFAEEHRYRVEQCGRYLGAYASHCTDCRAAHGAAKRARRDYDAFCARLNEGRREGVRDETYSHDDWAAFASSALTALDGGTLGLHGKIPWLLTKLDALAEEDPDCFGPLAKRLQDHFTEAAEEEKRRPQEFKQA